MQKLLRRTPELRRRWRSARDRRIAASTGRRAPKNAPRPGGDTITFNMVRSTAAMNADVTQRLARVIVHSNGPVE